MERNHVKPSYLHKIRTLVFNHAHHLLSADDAKKPWVQEALLAEVAVAKPQMLLPF